MSGVSGIRLVAIADADSFVKWAASLAGSVPGLRPHLLLVRTPLTVSIDQQRTALAGTTLAGDDVTRIDFAQAEGWLTRHRPDVVLLAGRGPFVRLMGRVIDALEHRPVTVSGLPGMAIPAQRGALDYRRHTDLLVVHSHREVRAFEELGRRIGVQVPTALATLPFARAGRRMLQPARRRVEISGAARGGVAVAVAEHPKPSAPMRPSATDIVFAAQALVPMGRAERGEIATMLVQAAEAEPARRVVVKLRSRPGESETHAEREPYRELLPRRLPENLVFSYDAMSTALESAAGLVTVSSTAAIEATAVGVPVIALDAFGVSKSLLNTVFVGSGLLGGRREVVGGRFRHPHPEWLADNYFHAEAESAWWERVEQLVALRRSGALPARRVPAARGGSLHEAWHRASVLGGEDRTPRGRVALAAGGAATRALSALHGRRAASVGGTWTDASTDYTLEPNPFQESTRR